MGGEQTIVSVGLPEGNLVTGLGESEPRSYKKRVVAAIGGLALVGAAIGVGIGASSGVDGGLAEAKGPTYSADIEGFADAVSIAAGVKNGSVKGRADLNIDNVLTWNLRKLESHASGTIHINIGRSCDDLGSSLWDAETGPNPWPSVSWTSDSKGKSSGSLDLDEIAGAYSFAANLGHAVVFYSSDEQVLACGVLKPEGDYRKFGVRSELNGGFVVHQDEATAGEVLVSKDNVMTWGMFNLEADQTGVVSVLAGGDCSDPDNTLFTGEWQTDKWGIAQGELALDSAVHDFARVVDRAVAFRSADGAVVACDTLSLFVEKMNEALRAVRQELKDIETTYKSDQGDDDDDGTQSQALAIIAELRDLPILCLDRAMEARASSSRLNNIAAFLAGNETAYTFAVQAISDGSATDSQVELVQEYEAFQQNKANELELIGGFTQFWNSNCLVTEECQAKKTEFYATSDEYYNAVSELENRAEEFALALAAAEAGSATPEQESAILEYNTFKRTVEVFEGGLDALIDDMDAVCLPNDTCEFNNLHQRCTNHEYYNSIRYSAAGKITSVTNIAVERAELQSTYQPALVAQANGNPTPEQEEVIRQYGLMGYQISRGSTSVARAQRAIFFNDPAPFGNISLSGLNVLSWQLESLPFNQTGYIMIHEGTVCNTASLGGQAASPGTSPYTLVSWDTTSAPDTNADFVSSQGSVDLSTLPGALPFTSNYPRSVVVYTAEQDQVACGVLTLED